MSINSVNLTGRLTRDPDVRYTDGGTSIARFTLAVDRRFKQDGGPTADFPSCVAFGRTAEFIERYFRQGMKLELTGRIQTGSLTGITGGNHIRLQNRWHGLGTVLCRLWHRNW